MCPRCHSAELHRSQRWMPKDLVMRIWGLRAFRCEQCRHRFFLPARFEKVVREDRRWVRSADHPHVRRR